MSDTLDTRAYRSKLGRLPFALRHELCERMLDGATGTELTDWLNALPALTHVATINAQNLTDWRRTGYAAWLRTRQKAQHVRDFAETAQHIAEAAGGDPTAVGSRILAGKMLDLLEAADAETAKDLAAAVAQLRKGESDAARVALATERQRLDEKRLSLDQDKFRHTLCTEFIRLVESERAMAIATGSGSNADKIQALLNFMDHEQGQP